MSKKTNLCPSQPKLHGKSMLYLVWKFSICLTPLPAPSSGNNTCQETTTYLPTYHPGTSMHSTWMEISHCIFGIISRINHLRIFMLTFVHLFLLLSRTFNNLTVDWKVSFIVMGKSLAKQCWSFTPAPAVCVCVWFVGHKCLEWIIERTFASIEL